ncbi:MAG: hypothetical protein IK997_06680 [Bacilli bacterium]|nr:hypothetical protein [Bacilli bacterium]
MNIYVKLDDLKNSLDKDKDIIEIKEIQNKILNDKTLIKKIKNNEDVSNNELIIKYKHLENRINYKILSINKELKSIME